MWEISFKFWAFLLSKIYCLKYEKFEFHHQLIGDRVWLILVAIELAKKGIGFS